MKQSEILEQVLNLNFQEDGFVTDPETNKTYRVKLLRSFISRLKQAPEDARGYYDELRNEIIAYKKGRQILTDRLSFRHETFKHGHKHAIEIHLRGKTLCLFFALNPKDFDGSKYKVEDMSSFAYFKDTPCLYRIKNQRRFEYAKELIAKVLNGLGYRQECMMLPLSYSAMYPYSDTKTLVKEGLVKIELVEVGKWKNDPIILKAPPRVLKEAPKGFQRTKVEKVSDNRFSIEFHKSFKAKLCALPDDAKEFYSKLKNELLSFNGMKCHYYWGDETFRCNSEVQAKLAFIGKTLCLYLPLDAKDYEGTKYDVESIAGKKKFEDIPALYRIRNSKRFRYALDLIDDAYSKKKFKKVKGRKPVDYTKDIPTKDNETLLSEGLIRRVSSN